jgi:two-component system cell cycle sensor histidine kinase/response regulator CckA
METVLVVEPLPGILEYLRLVLVTEGYSVLTAAGAEEAIEAAAQSPYPVDLLITDVAMPGRSRPLMVGWLREQWPSLKVVFMSNYSKAIVVDLGLPWDTFFLQKPFLPLELKQIVRDVLAGSGKRWQSVEYPAGVCQAGHLTL